MNIRCDRDNFLYGISLNYKISFPFNDERRRRSGPRRSLDIGAPDVILSLRGAAFRAFDNLNRRCAELGNPMEFRSGPCHRNRDETVRAIAFFARRRGSRMIESRETCRAVLTPRRAAGARTVLRHRRIRLSSCSHQQGTVRAVPFFMRSLASRRRGSFDKRFVCAPFLGGARRLTRVPGRRFRLYFPGYSSKLRFSLP